MQTATLTNEGLCQSVKLPQGFHLEGNEVYVKHLGKAVLIIPKNVNPWDLMAESLHQFTDDFMGERAQPPQQQRKELGA